MIEFFILAGVFTLGCLAGFIVIGTIVLVAEVVWYALAGREAQ